MLSTPTGIPILVNMMHTQREVGGEIVCGIWGTLSGRYTYISLHVSTCTCTEPNIATQTAGSGSYHTHHFQHTIILYY